MKLNAVLIYVEDFPRALAFYRDVLGLTSSAKESGAGYERLVDWVMLEPGGGAVVELFDRTVHPSPLEPTAERRNAVLPAFQVEDLPETVAALEAKGANLVTGVVTEEWGWAVFLRDPEGNVIQLFEPAEP